MKLEQLLENFNGAMEFIYKYLEYFNVNIDLVKFEIHRDDEWLLNAITGIGNEILNHF